MNLCEEISFPANLQSLHDILKFISDRGESFGLSEKGVAKAELAVEEAVVNIIKHADNEKEVVTIACAKKSNSLVITIKDSGLPFDPTASVAEGEGRGILLMRASAKVEYRRQAGKNVLTLSVAD